MTAELDQLRIVEAQFEELSDRLSKLLELHAGDEPASSRLRAAVATAKRGAELTRAHMRTVPEDS